jgi:FAD/FMN-containing dehydrogenase
VKSTIRVDRTRWRNWSGEITCTPRRLYCDESKGPWRSPRTLEDLQAIVRDARAEGAKVRVFGSSHSWSRLVPVQDGYIVDGRMIGSQDGWYRPSIEPGSADGARKARATGFPGMLSGEFEEWLWGVGYSMPASAFEDCFTLGGMAATATHGTGLAFGTVSDMIVGATFVDGLGNVRRWTRETATADELAAIQCGLGCLGLIYDLTFEVEPRYEALHEARTVPYDSLFADTDAARVALRELHESHTSIEFFWWPFQFSGIPGLSRPTINPNVWILSTKKVFPATARPRGAIRRFLHLNILDFFAMLGNGLFLRQLRSKPRWSIVMVWLLCFTPAWVWLRSGSYRMPQYDANHFVNAGGVEFVLAIASEWSLPFRRDADLSCPDSYERVRAAYAVLHDLVVEAFETHDLTDPRASPILLSVEMRTLAASTALMSPGYQPDDQRERVCIVAPEIVTTVDHPAWREFAHAANLAMTKQPEVFGAEVRCHQGKPCHAFPHPDYRDGGMRSYLREQYRAAGSWDRFLAVRQDVDPDGIFLNEYLRAWFGPDLAPTREMNDVACDQVAMGSQSEVDHPKRRTG